MVVWSSLPIIEPLQSVLSCTALFNSELTKKSNDMAVVVVVVVVWWCGIVYRL